MKNYSHNCKPRAVFITGGTRGIGKAAVFAFAKANYRVAFCYKTQDKLANEIVFNLQKQGYFVCAFKCDVSNATEVLKLAIEVKKTFGFIDTIINNVGTAHKKLFLDEDLAGMQGCFNSNFSGTFNVIKAFAPNMLSNNFGRIINLSSVFGVRGASCESIYSAAKGAIISFTKALAKEYATNNVTVNAVAPGFIDTDMNSNLTYFERAQFLKSVSLGRVGTPNEIADSLVFLASYEAGYITGEVLSVNGGM